MLRYLLLVALAVALVLTGLLLCAAALRILQALVESP